MEWRCEWCGKPHEENDPPCDNCGHSEFEKAVVPMAPEAEDDDPDTMTVWVCTECGNDHPKHTPPCDRCGAGPLEKRDVEYDEAQVVDEMLSADESVPSADVSYLDVLDMQLVLLFLGVGLLVVVLGLGFLGIVDVPFLPNTGASGPAPGNGTTVNGLSLSTVEQEYVTELNVRRAQNGYENLTLDPDVSAAATAFNKENVRADYADGDGPNEERIASQLDDACDGAEPAPVVFIRESSVRDNEFVSERDMALALVSSSENRPDAAFEESTNRIVGVDVHVAPDGRIYVTQFVC